MSTYIVVNHHTPEECEPMEKGLEHLPEHLQGRDFICTCPEGPHGFFMMIPGETAEEVIEGLPAEWRRGSSAYPVEVITL